MTLIISVLTWGKVLQVSDRRLFNTDTGTSEDDHSNKMITMPCLDASLSIAYTGLAKVGSPMLGTVDWLTNSLNNMDSPTLTINDIRVQLSREWRKVMSMTPIHRSLAGLTSSIVIAGFFRIGEPFALRIHSNRTDEFFQANIKKKSKLCAVVIDGQDPFNEQDAIGKELGKRIKKLRRKRYFQKNTKEDGVKELVSLIRATQLGPYGKFIGTNCLGISIVPHPTLIGNFVINSEYYGEEYRDYWGPYHTHISEHGIIGSPD